MADILDGMKNASVGLTRAVDGDEAANHEAASWDAFKRGDLATSAQESHLSEGAADAHWLSWLGFKSGSGKKLPEKGVVKSVKDGLASFTEAVDGPEAAAHYRASLDALQRGDMVTHAREDAASQGAGAAYWLRKIGLGGSDPKAR